MTPILHLLLFGIFGTAIKVGGWALLALFLYKFFGPPIGRFRPINSPKAKYYGCAIIVMLGLLLAVLFQGSFIHTVLLLAGALCFIPLSIVLAVFVLIPLLKGQPLHDLLRRAILVWCAFACAFALSYGVGNGIRIAREHITRDYVAATMPILDEIKARDGSYPTTLPVSLAKQPHFAYDVSYSSDGKIFRFAYDDAAGMMDAYELFSSDRIWRYYSA